MIRALCTFLHIIVNYRLKKFFKRFILRISIPVIKLFIIFGKYKVSAVNAKILPKYQRFLANYFMCRLMGNFCASRYIFLSKNLFKSCETSLTSRFDVGGRAFHSRRAIDEQRAKDSNVLSKKKVTARIIRRCVRAFCFIDSGKCNCEFYYSMLLRINFHERDCAA